MAITTVFLASSLHRPVFLEGPAGSGKTQLAYAVAQAANQLMLQVAGKPVIGISNIWTPTSASGVVALDANREYEVAAQGGPGGVQLAMRLPQDTTSFRSQVGQTIDYYFFYGPELTLKKEINQSESQR